MRRDNRGPRNTFGNRPPNVDDDGSGGRFVRGLPADHVPGLAPNAPLEFNAQSGAPNDRSGGTYTAAIDRPARDVEPSLAPKPFKLK